MTSFEYVKPFETGADQTPYRLLSSDFVSCKKIGGRSFLEIDPKGLALLAREAFHDVSFFLRPAHLKQVAAILKDPEASENDRFVADTLLKNAVISAHEALPSCQDTGTAVVCAKKGESVLTGAEDAQFLSEGIYEAFQKDALRYSQILPLGMFEEVNSGTNLPAQIEIFSTPGSEYHFLFLAKGGGSANKTFLYQQTKSLLNEKSLAAFLQEKLFDLGTAACPPYHIAVVIGGTSAEATLKTVKLASAGYYDQLPTRVREPGEAYRDLEWEEKVLKMAAQTGVGAQFGGKYLAHDVRVIRLPRHAASCPVGIGVSCSADRNIKAKITAEGIFLEELEKQPEKWLLESSPEFASKPVSVNLDRPMKEVLEELRKYPLCARLSLTGTLIVARDAAHARIQKMLEEGKPIPEYFKRYPVYYAGPSKTPSGMVTGSFGPTTASRMDLYTESFMSQGGSLIMIAKGNRSPSVAAACKKYGGFYLGSIGGPAAILAKENIEEVKLLDFEDLGMEAIRQIRVKDFPAFIITHSNGEDFFHSLHPTGI